MSNLRSGIENYKQIAQTTHATCKWQYSKQQPIELCSRICFGAAVFCLLKIQCYRDNDDDDVARKLHNIPHAHNAM